MPDIEWILKHGFIKKDCMHRFIFPLSLFFSASLLFIIQPMVGKVLLPIYGGTPAVWTVCMLFFQAILLLAYAYAWILSRIGGVGRWRVVHLCVCMFSLIVWPLVFTPVLNNGAPEFHILMTLLLQLGLPLLVIGASAPLLQYAFSQTGGTQAADPYFLYAASNAGSLIALLAYPLLVERYSGINLQFYIWNGIYALYLILLFWVLFAVRFNEPTCTLEKAKPLAWPRMMSWIFLSFIPCSLMLGVTFFISTDIAATPLFWVLPLALYLLSFVVTFARKPIISHARVVRFALFFLVLPISGFIIGVNQIPAWLLIFGNLIVFFVLALLCHGELVRARPPVNQLTTFYLCLALGGVLAGLFNGLIAPRIFVHAYDYPLVLLVSVLCIPIPKKQHEWLVPTMVLAILVANYFLQDSPWMSFFKTKHVVEFLSLAMLVMWPASVRSVFVGMAVLFMFVFMPWFKPEQILVQTRNFYGVKQVFSQAGAHVLMSHSTMHGFQVLQDENPTDGARAYYASVLPVVQNLQASHQPLRAMVLGLGTGIMSCQFRAEDNLKMVEIDEQVIDIASNPKLFSYLRDCPVNTTLIRDDGLLAVAHADDASLELLVMDAFTSDAIPVHLLTLEAFTLYQKKITTDGVILVNMSNRHLRILPVLTGAGRKLDMIVLHKSHPGNSRLGQLASEWALLTTNEELAGRLLVDQGWRFVAEENTILWTNNYSNLVPLFKWRSSVL